MYLDKILDNEPVFEKVEDFIKKLHEHDIQLNEKAQKFMVPLPKSGVFGKTTEEHALSDIIAKEMAHYQRILYSENISNAFLTKSEAKDAPVEDVKNFVAYLNLKNVTHAKKSEVANKLFFHIELARTNNLIDAIGLGKKLKALEEENEDLKRKNANIQKVNDRLVRENTQFNRIFPDAMKDKSEVGDLGKLDS